MHPLLRTRPGMALIYLTVAMAVFIAFVSLGLDTSRVYLAKRQLQFAADAAARYGASALPDITAARNQAVAAAGLNVCDGSAVVLRSSDIDVGTWDSSAGTFTVLPSGSFTQPNAIRVKASRTAAGGNAVRLIFAGIVGQNTCDVHATAIAGLATSPYGIVGINSVSMSGGATNSYFSATSTTGYVGSPQNSGTVASNGNITLAGGAIINGSAFAGPGMTVSASAGAVTGTSGNLTQPLSFPNATAGSAATANNDAAIPSAYFNSTTLDLSLASGASLALSGGTYYIHNFTMSGNSTLSFTGPVTFYVTGSINLTGGSISTSGNLPSNFRVNMCSSGTVSMSGGSTLYADIYAPQSAFNLSGGGTLAGRVVALSVTESGGSNMYFDLSLVGGVGSAVYLAQ